jgi:hypothetical protein
VEVLVEPDHWSALDRANHRLEALYRHLSVATEYGDDIEERRIRSDIASIYALRRRLLRDLGADFSGASFSHQQGQEAFAPVPGRPSLRVPHER